MSQNNYWASQNDKEFRRILGRAHNFFLIYRHMKQRPILVLSSCIKNDSHEYHFHFRGYLNGRKLDGLRVNKESSNFSFEVGEAYLLWATIWPDDESLHPTIIVKKVKSLFA